MINRRQYLAGSTALLLTGAIDDRQTLLAAEDFDPAQPLPHKSAFFPLRGTYLNSASQHPLSRGGRQAIDRYLDYKTFSTDSEHSNSRIYQDVLEKYARLINADKSEVCYVQSTTVGENLILRALGLPASGGRIVTDELHFVGSLPTYDRLRREGIDVEILQSEAGTIGIEQFERAITPGTRLVALSSVSMANGFRHDLRAICEIAHARGALVYADIIQEVGNTPIDVRETGVDFCSAASYKWLMADMGLGFLYVRNDRLTEIDRPWYGHNQYRRRESFAFPYRGSEARIADYEHINGALGYFAMGTQANVVCNLLDYSLGYLLDTGVARIQAYRQPLVDALQERIPELGFPPLTPRDAGTALVSFRHDGNPGALQEKLRAANITATVAAHHMRISPSVFNDMDDVERLVDALS